MAFTLIPTLEKCGKPLREIGYGGFGTRICGILVNGVNAFIEDMFIIVQPSLPTISSANTCVGSSVPIKLRLNTNSTPEVKIKECNQPFGIRIFGIKILFCGCCSGIVAARTVYSMSHFPNFLLTAALASRRLCFPVHWL